MTTKTLMRAEVKSRLAQMTPLNREDAALRIQHRILSLPELETTRTVLLYASLPGEVATDSVADELRRMGKRVTYPRSLPATREMTLHAVRSTGELLVDGPYGIREPAMDSEIIQLGEIDIVFMPGLAWDRVGQRLGRGAGYYDRLLGDDRWKGIRCGVFFATQEVRLVPADPWDIPMNLVVTENETARFATL